MRIFRIAICLVVFTNFLLFRHTTVLASPTQRQVCDLLGKITETCFIRNETGNAQCSTNNVTWTHHRDFLISGKANDIFTPKMIDILKNTTEGVLLIKEDDLNGILCGELNVKDNSTLASLMQTTEQNILVQHINHLAQIALPKDPFQLQAQTWPKGITLVIVSHNDACGSAALPQWLSYKVSTNVATKLISKLTTQLNIGLLSHREWSLYRDPLNGTSTCSGKPCYIGHYWIFQITGCT